MLRKGSVSKPLLVQSTCISKVWATYCDTTSLKRQNRVVKQPTSVQDVSGALLAASTMEPAAAVAEHKARCKQCMHCSNELPAEIPRRLEQYAHHICLEINQPQPLFHPIFQCFTLASLQAPSLRMTDGVLTAEAVADEDKSLKLQKEHIWLNSALMFDKRRL